MGPMVPMGPMEPMEPMEPRGPMGPMGPTEPMEPTGPMGLWGLWGLYLWTLNLLLGVSPGKTFESIVWFREFIPNVLTVEDFDSIDFPLLLFHGE